MKFPSSGTYIIVYVTTCAPACAPACGRDTVRHAAAVFSERHLSLDHTEPNQSTELITLILSTQSGEAGRAHEPAA